MNAFAYCVVVGALWGSWQLFARASGVPPLTMALFASVIGLIPIGIASMLTNTNLFSMNLKQLVLISLAGLTLGGGMVMYSFLITNREWNLSIYVPVATVLIAIVVVLGSIFFFKESLDTRTTVGIGLALVSLWFLS